ncbi:mus-101, partial [Pristionchus pacificus]
SMNAPKKRRSSIGRPTQIMDPDEDGDMNDDVPFLFVMEVPSSCDEELKNFHETLFGVMEKKNIQPKHISRSEVLSVQKSTADIYVLPQFEGPEFEHLMSKGCKVVGPFVVDRCMKANTRLPKWRHPIYALTMKGAVVCFSGLTKRKKAMLSDMVRHLGGQVSNDLHDKVTVLIAKNCDTNFPKYTESAKLKIPILREDWITDSWKEVVEQLSDTTVTNAETYDQYRVPLFKDMVITVSGLKLDERSNAGRMIEMGRGTFAPEMSKATCTHLITDKNSGDKFKRAREWGNIHIVTMKWLTKSIEMGYVQKETHYDPERVRASTPTKGAKPPDELDFSMVAPRPAGPGGLNNTTLSSGLNSSTNMTMRTPNECSVVRPSFIRHDSSRRILDSSTLEEPRIYDATMEIDINMMNGDEDFFEGLRIFLIGIGEIREPWWKKMLNWSGATRATRIDVATHIVVGGPLPDKTILNCGKPVLTTEWVVACMKSRRLMPHTDYIFTGAPAAPLNQSLISSVNGPLKKTPAKASQTMRTRAISQQVLAAPIPTPSSSTSLVHSNSLRRSTNAPPPSSSVGGRTVFKNITFKISEEMKVERDQMKVMIEGGGGSVVTSPSSPAHYLLCTLLDYGTATSSSHKAQDVVSVFWLYRCIDSCSLVSPSSHPLFRPLPACRGSIVFEGLVVYLTAFQDEQEMFAYMSLLKQYGAQTILQGEGIPRGVIPTHTIAGGVMKERMMSGQKALDPSWVIECIIHDKILLEDNFIFKSKAYASYEGRKDDLWEWDKCEERREESREGRSISRQKDQTLIVEERGGGDSEAILDMGAFDEPMEDEGEEPMEEHMNRTEPMDEDDSMVREITEEMEMNEREGRSRHNRSRTQVVPPSFSSAVSSRTPRVRSAATPGSVHHPRLQMLRNVATPSTPSSPSHGPIPTISSPTQFLHPTAIPKLIIPGVQEYLDEISSPCNSEADRSIDQLSTSGVGRMLDGMVVTTGRANNDMMETPIRGTSILEEGEMDLSIDRRPSNGVRRNILESTRLERGENGRGEGGGERRERREEQMETQYSSNPTDSRETNDTIDVDDDSPRDSTMVLPPELEKRRRELAEQMAAALASSKMKEEEERAAISSNSTTTSGEKGSERKEGGMGVVGGIGGGRSRRKRRNLNDMQETEVKRLPPIVTPPLENVSPLPTPTLPVIGWDAATLESRDDDVNADHSRILDSPIKVRRDPTMPSTSRSTVADRSIASTVASSRSTKPLVTPSKTLRARVPPPIDEKTQAIEKGGGGGDVVGEKSARKSKSTAAISRRGRGKENGELRRIFAFTSLEGKMRDQCMEAVRSLGGKVTNSEGFDPETTHVVTGKMIRNEKLLSGMAGGVFILKPSYVIESEKEKKWIQEEEHEWSNNMGDVCEKDLRLVESISRWKRQVQNQRSTLLVEGIEGKVGAFVGWRVVFYALTRSRVEPMMRIVKAGGGEAVLREDVQREDIETLLPTHVLVDGTMTDPTWMWNLEELRFIHSLGARAFPIDFLFKFLTTDRIIESNHYHPEYRKILI